MPDAIGGKHLPTQVGNDDVLQSGRAHDEDDQDVPAALGQFLILYSDGSVAVGCISDGQETKN